MRLTRSHKQVMLRAVKGSNPTPGEYYAFSGGHTWSIVGEHFDNTTFCIPLVPAYIQLALVCTRVVAVILYMTTNFMNTSRIESNAVKYGNGTRRLDDANDN